MKKMSFLFLLACVFVVPVGCDSGENSVVEAPPEVEEDAAMEGMTDEDYDAAMEASMNEGR